MSNFAIACKSYQTSPVASVSEHADVREAYALLTERRTTSLAVVDAEDKICGVLSLGDLVMLGTPQAGYPRDLELPLKGVSEMMNSKVISMPEGEPLQTAAELMLRHGIHRVYVLDKVGRPTAVVSSRDLLLAVKDRRIDQSVSKFMVAPVVSVDVQDPISTASERLARTNPSGVVVLEQGDPVGVFTRRDARWTRHMDPSVAVEDAMSPSVLTVSARTRLFRAAAQASAMHAHRVVVTEDGQLKGILGGLDFARALLD